jgi:hypothetical protein
MVSAAAPVRHALIVAASSPQYGLRAASAAADAEEYEKLLRLLGFQVTVIGMSDRPDLDHSLREFVSQLPTGAEVATFFLGSVVADGDGMLITAADSPPGIEARPELFASEGIRIADVLRRISTRGPRELVAIVDECAAPLNAQNCQAGSPTFPAGVSAIVGIRKTASRGAAPMAAMASLRADLIPLMQREGETFLKLFSGLNDRIANGNVTIVGTSALTSTFAFLPSDFFARLPHDCNRVDAGMDVGSLRTAPLESLISKCQQAVQTWSFSTLFAQKLAIAREQRAFQKATTSCGDQASISAYLSGYPSGMYRTNVEQFASQCAPPPPPPSVALSPPPPPPPPAPLPVQPSVAQLQQSALEALRQYYHIHSSDSPATWADYEELYAAEVFFYNKLTDRSAIARAKVDGHNTWPVRHFTIREDTLSFDCDLANQSCKVRGFVISDFRDPSGAPGGGSRQFSFLFIYLLTGHPQVRSECVVGKRMVCD